MNLTVLRILCGGIVFFTVATLAVVYTRPDDGQLYTLFAGILTSFTGGLMIYLNIHPRPTPPTPPEPIPPEPDEPK